MNDMKYCVFCMEAVSADTEPCPHCGRASHGEMALPHQLSPGTVLSSRYLVGAVLGEGGFGITYIGRDLNLDVRVAIKEYYPSGFVNRNHTHSGNVTANTGEQEVVFNKGKDSFLKEARILAKFSMEPGVVGVRDFFKENNTAYITMDFLEGITLKTWLEQCGKIPTNQILSLMKPIMTALSSIHKQGLIHRDISPDNIMLMKDGSLKLLDFGAARTMSGLDEKSLSVMLKPGYAPEEQYRSRGVQGPWTDIYALCATIYKCVTGVALDDAMQRVFEDETKAPSELGTQITQAQEAALLKGIAVLQKNRFQFIDELWAAFFGAAASNITAPPPTMDTTPPSNENSTVLAEPVAPGTPERTMFAGTSAVPVAPVAPPTHIPEPPPPPAPPVAPEKKAKEKPKKKKRGRKILLGTLIGIIGIIVISTVWSLLGTLDNVQIGGRTFTRDTRSVTLMSAPSLEELELLKNLPNLETLTLRYTSGLDNDALRIVGQLTTLRTLALGRTDVSAPPLELDLSLIADLNLVALTLRYQSNLDLSPLRGMSTLSILRIYDSPALDLSPLRDIPTLSVVSINDSPVFDLSPLVDLPRLLNLQINRSVEDISTLAGIANLTVVNLNENLISDLTPLRYSVNLNELRVDANQLESLDGLESLTQIRTLSARGNQISDISSLSEMSHLWWLSIDHNNIDDISPLSNLERLRWFSANNNQIKDLTPLAASSDRLDRIYVNNNNLSNLDALYEFIRLERVYAANNNLICIGGLTNATQLERVNFNNNQISDITVLAKSAEQLEWIQMANNQISDISPLRGMTALTLLALEGNIITDISPLRESVSMRSLFLHGNVIIDIDAVSEMAELQFLDVSNNQINRIDAVSGLFQRERNVVLDISSNNITDISPIPDTTYAYAALFIENNPIRDVSHLSGMATLVLAFTYLDGVDYTPLEELRILPRFYAVDTPLDRRVNLERVLTPQSWRRVNFVSEEEIFLFKQEQRDSVTGYDRGGGEEGYAGYGEEYYPEEGGDE